MAIRYILLLASGLVLADSILFPLDEYQPKRKDLYFNKLFESERNQIEDEKVKVNIYYEAFCLGCIMEYQSLPNILNKIGDQVILSTYPYGHAHTDPKTHEVTCQHGLGECYGNMLHACAIDIIKDRNTYINYNACVITRYCNDDAADSCGYQLNVDSVSIKKCAKGPKGHELLIWYGEETEKAHLPHFVPYTVINGKPADRNYTLFENICKAFKKPPAGCKKLL